MVDDIKRETKAPSPARASKRMSPSDVAKVRKIVREWPSSPMSWDLIRERVLVEVQIPGKTAARKGKSIEGWTRQALSSHAEIKQAYQERKKELAAELRRDGKNPARNSDPEVVLLRKERDDLRIKVSELEKKLAEYEELFHRTVYNRFVRESDDDDPTRPLPRKDDRLGRDRK
jgi:hypothetical protein